MYNLIDKRMSYLDLHKLYPNMWALIYSNNIDELSFGSADSTANIYAVGTSKECAEAFIKLSNEKAGIRCRAIPTSPTDDIIMFEDDFQRIYGG